MRNHSTSNAMIMPLALLSLALLLSCGAQQSDKSGAGNSTKLASQSPGRDSVTVVLVGEDSVSVFDLLQRSHQVQSLSTAMGVFVNGIDSLKNSQRAVWIFSVNDTMPDIASNKKITRTGDKVVWHYRLMQ